MGRKSGIEKLRNNNYLRTIDYYLVVPILLLTIIGLYVLNKVLSHGYAAYPNNLYRQIASAVAGIIITIMLCLLDTQFMRLTGWLIYAGALFLLILVPIDNYNLTYLWGADSWLKLPVIGNFQPSELAKIGLVMAVSDVFEKMSSKEISYLKDFGPAMVIVFSFVCILFVWGLKYRYFLLAASSVIVIGLPLVWNFYLKEYQKKRILSLIFEGSDVEGEYNLVQSKAAIASGGLSGNNTGVTISVPVKESDFIYSAISEHLGFIGTTAVLILAFFFLARCFYVASKTSRKSFSYIVVGLAASFAFHFIENMGMSVGLLPVTGIPLPFISLGGTAMLVNYISFGIILNISMGERQ